MRYLHPRDLTIYSKIAWKFTQISWKMNCAYWSTFSVPLWWYYTRCYHKAACVQPWGNLLLDTLPFLLVGMLKVLSSISCSIGLSTFVIPDNYYHYFYYLNYMKLNIAITKIISVTCQNNVNELIKRHVPVFSDGPSSSNVPEFCWTLYFILATITLTTFSHKFKFDSIHQAFLFHCWYNFGFE
jgi:hypothetical protein